MTRAGFLEHIANGCIRYGGTTESWIRESSYNASDAVKGHPESFHITGEAVDAWFHSKGAARNCKRYWERKGIHCKWNGEKTVHAQIVPYAPPLEGEG